ncbi:hypothetical protein DPMN_038261 [Dreissena polymorpha]|uniref:Uncharacterized protein n=1 Tax=Dreissena polymorpha TaxID=45954 RepID=A0A9D4MCF2_DREPO|nr:hypothetical protein DPMN_038261 [Dreissena polymorpha]
MTDWPNEDRVLYKKNKIKCYHTAKKTGISNSNAAELNLESGHMLNNQSTAVRGPSRIIPYAAIVLDRCGSTRLF